MWTANLFQVISGVIGPRIEFESLSWSIELNGTEDIRVTLNKKDLPQVDLARWLSPWWAGVVIFWNGTPIVAGPIISRPSESFRTVSISCGGIRSLLAKRLVSLELTDWSKQSTSAVSYKDMSLGTIAKRVVQQAQNKRAGNLPITYAVPDEIFIGRTKHERNYRGFNVQNIDCDDVLTKLSNVIDGPDIMFRPKLIRDNALVFEMWNGTEAEPRIYQTQTPVWDSTAVEGSVTDTTVTITGSYQTFRTYSVGAGQDEGTLIKVNTNEAPLQLQYPLLETAVTTSSSENPVVVDDHGISNLWTNRVPLMEMQMTVRGDGVIPFGQFWPGDLVKVVTKDWISIPDGTAHMRLLSMTGDSSNNVKVSLQMDDRFLSEV